MEIPFTSHRLDNGLDVLVHEDRGCPIVAVNLWYHVGSKNEVPGRTGFAHLFEHLMFEGSKHFDRGLLSPAAGSRRLAQRIDQRRSDELLAGRPEECARARAVDGIGSDGLLLPALTPAKFDNQREVVLNERRQNYENRPYGLAGMAIMAALYPAEHPYHWLTIGAAEDIRAARLDDVKAFFQTLLPPGQRLAGHRRRRRHRRCGAAGDG